MMGVLYYWGEEKRRGDVRHKRNWDRPQKTGESESSNSQRFFEDRQASYYPKKRQNSEQIPELAANFRGRQNAGGVKRPPKLRLKVLKTWVSM
jgi:hypothetical protein